MSPKKTRSRRTTRSAASPSQRRVSNDPIRVMIVDDHPIWRDTLRNLLEEEGEAVVVAEAEDGSEVLDLVLDQKPDVVLMDINMPNLDGIQATRQLLGGAPKTKVLVLASSDERAQVIESVRAGASGYLLKTAAPTEVVEAVVDIYKGQLVFPPSLADVVLEELRRPPQPTPGSLGVAILVPSMVERKGIQDVLEEAGFDVIVSQPSLESVSKIRNDASVGVVMIDSELLGLSGKSNGLEQVLHSLPHANVLVLTDDPDVDGAISLLSSSGRGVGYVMKRRISKPHDLIAAVRRVSLGGSVLDSQVVNRLVDAPGNVRSLDELTGREREVLALMAEGHSNQAIAEHLFLGAKTVEGHVRSIFMKLGLEPAADIHRRVLAVIAYLRSS